MGSRPPPSETALRIAREWIANEFEESGCSAGAAQYRHEPGFTTAPLRAFAKFLEAHGMFGLEPTQSCSCGAYECDSCRALRSSKSQLERDRRWVRNHGGTRG